MPPWDKYSGQVDEKPQGPWAKHAPASQEEPYSFSILPFSKDAQGNDRFDSNAGILGVFKRAFMAPGEVLQGKLDPYSEEGASRAREAATVISPGSAAISAGERVIPGQLKNLQPRKVEPPSVETLKSAAKAGYEEARNMGVDYSTAGIKNVAASLQKRLEEEGVLDKLGPQTHAILRELQSAPEGAVISLSGVDTARKALNNIAQQNAGPLGNRTEAYAAQRAIKELDNFLAGPGEANVVAGPAAAAGAKITDARGDYAAAMRSEKLTGAGERAELNAAVANSGLNVGNQTRQRVRDILVKPKESRGFSDEELGLLEQLARGSKTENTLRFAGNVLGGGGGLGTTVSSAVGATTGALAAGTPGAAVGAALPPALGYGSRQLANTLTQRRLNTIDQTLRMRSPLYRQMVKEAGQEAQTMEGRAALLRLWFTDQMAGEGGQ
jgi:hypothetical protein